MTSLFIRNSLVTEIRAIPSLVFSRRHATKSPLLRAHARKNECVAFGRLRQKDYGPLPPRKFKANLSLETKKKMNAI